MWDCEQTKRSGDPYQTNGSLARLPRKRRSKRSQATRIIGAGAAGLEVVLALRRRWPRRALELQQRRGQLRPAVQQLLRRANVAVVDDDSDHSGPSLLCTGSQGSAWLATTGLPLDHDGRVRTDRLLRVEGHPCLFASGDCAVISASPRPASGVWAVRAGRPLATNLEAACQGRQLLPWHPQRQALQLISSHMDTAWARWGGWQLGPSPLLWHLKQRIDRAFMAGFQRPTSMNDVAPMACRGCAAKLPAQPLTAALTRVGLGNNPKTPRVSLAIKSFCKVDGFPALVSDPWLNGRLTALHASSDLWACGARVSSAMATITLPLISANEQQELLVQTLAGIRSALDEQGAELIGGHTMESRSTSPTPASLGVQISLTVNGESTKSPWLKTGLHPGDALLISRPLGTGVLFAGAMSGVTKAADLDAALMAMAYSQHSLLEQLDPIREKIHACTDITGFGLLGHLGEMLQNRSELTLKLKGHAIPAYPGAIGLFEQGLSSSLAPSNRAAWRWLDGQVHFQEPPSSALLELLVDPQTCGPLLLACTRDAAAELTKQGPWVQVGSAAAATE